MNSVEWLQHCLDVVIGRVHQQMRGSIEPMLSAIYGSEMITAVRDAYSRVSGDIAPISPSVRSRSRLKRLTSQSENAEDGSDSFVGGSTSQLQQACKGGLNILSQPPSIKNIQMNDYQLDGLRWISSLYESGLGAILGDEMGLGKTIQAISYLAWLRDEYGIRGPHLVVAPTSTLNAAGGWPNEIKRFDKCRVVVLQGSQDDRQEILTHAFRRQAGHANATDGSQYGFDVMLTSFSIALTEKRFLEKVHWHSLVVDEAHRLKNAESQLYQSLSKYDVQFKLLLTGTPVMNHLRELGSLLRFSVPAVFDCSEAEVIFQQFFSLLCGHASVDSESITPLLTTMHSEADDAGSSEPAAEEAESPDLEQQAVARGVNSQEANSVIHMLHCATQPFLLRRTKEQLQLPPKTELTIFCPLSETQTTVYHSILRDSQRSFTEWVHERDGMLRNTSLNNVVVQLRKCCAHPYLIDGVEPQPIRDGEHLVVASGKLAVLDRLLPRIFRDNGRVLIFSPFTRTLDILEDYLDYRQWPYLRLDGAMSLEDREQSVRSFNEPGSHFNVFLLSTRAGGLGLNLASANTVVLYDSEWNPFMDLQAADRAHRIGQQRPVTVYRLITDGTLEIMIHRRQQLKLRLDRIVLKSNRFQATPGQGVKTDELMAAVAHGANDIFMRVGSRTGDVHDEAVTDEELDRIIALSREQARALDERLSAVESQLEERVRTAAPDEDVTQVNVEELVALEDRTQATAGYREFNGVDYSKAAAENLAQLAAASTLEEKVTNQRRSAADMRRKFAATSVPALSSFLLPERSPCGLYPVELYVLQSRARRIGQRRYEEYKEAVEQARQRADQLTPDAETFPLPQRDTSPLLSPSDEERRQVLYKSPLGFPDWTRRDCYLFVRSVAAHGRHDLAEIARDLHMPVNEVERYSAVFFNPERGYKAVFDPKEASEITHIIEQGTLRAEQQRRALRYFQERLASDLQSISAELLPLNQDSPIVEAAGTARVYNDEKEPEGLRLADLVGHPELTLRTYPRASVAVATAESSCANLTAQFSDQPEALRLVLSQRAVARFTLPRKSAHVREWSAADDRLLLQAALKHNYSDWTSVAADVRGDPAAALLWQLKSRVTQPASRRRDEVAARATQLLESVRKEVEAVQKPSKAKSQKPLDMSAAGRASLEDLRQAFTVFDTNQDGMLSRTEIADVLISLDLNSEKHHLDSLFSEIDIDGDGKISFEEFRRLVDVELGRDKIEDEYRSVFERFSHKLADDDESMSDCRCLCSANDLLAVALELGVQMTQEDAERMIHFATGGLSDRCSFEQYLRAVSL